MDKPLGQRSYGSIPHLPTSRRGPKDIGLHEGQARICLERSRDRHDEILVQEKLDGSCCAVARIDGEIVALGRAGYLAQTSRFEQHQLFAQWVRKNERRFYHLAEGHRIVGEWLAQAHGTRYVLFHEPFVPFDVMRGTERLAYDDFLVVVKSTDLTIPRLLHRGGPFALEKAQALLAESGHGAIDPVEGAVWRVQRRGEVDFLAKWVRSDKVDGCYLPERSGVDPIWNWRP